MKRGLIVVIVSCVSAIALLIFVVVMCVSALAQASGGASREAQAPIGQNPASARLGVFVYPKKNQSAAQQQKDETECYNWAKQQTGVNPEATPSESQKAKTGKGGGAKGAAGGAAGGAAIGAIAGNAGKGAAIGATTGAVVGRRRQKRANKQAQQQAEQQASAQQQEAINRVKSAFSSCIDARGYSVR